MADPKNPIDDPQVIDDLVAQFLEMNVEQAGVDPRVIASAMLFNAMDALLHVDEAATVKSVIDTMWGLAKEKCDNCGCPKHRSGGTPGVH